MPSWFVWVVATMLLIDAVIAPICRIGRPRKPLTGGEVAIQVVIYGLIIAGLFVWGLK